jgi:hypothetical protein
MSKILEFIRVSVNQLDADCEYALKWIRDYILGSIATLIILAFVLPKKILEYFCLCLSKRMGLMKEWEDGDDAE